MISIVTSYYNRKKLFYRTLKSIEKSAYKDFEFIAVDDASQERIEDLKFPFLKVIRVEPEDKWYTSACVPLNMGIKEAVGDIILLQNPECLHVHDVLSYIAENVNDSNYISMGTYSLNEELTNGLDEVDIQSFFNSLPQQEVTDYVGWYNHSTYRPVNYPFCGAITLENMNKLQGFDERYAMGIGYEDNELIDRITGLGLSKIIKDDVAVIHQWHPKVYDLINDDHMALWTKNELLYIETRSEIIV